MNEDEWIYRVIDQIRTILVLQLVQKREIYLEIFTDQFRSRLE